MHDLKLEDLSDFYGTEHWYKHCYGAPVTYTDGVQYVAEHGGAYWLIDEIVFGSRKLVKDGEEFQCWRLTVDLEKKEGKLVCTDGDYRILSTKDIEFTDFPLPEISIWLVNEVMLLPSEY
jgi:hypothetical protein